MSEVSRSLFRLGDQFRQGFKDQGQHQLDVAELGLKEAGLKRQARMDELQRPALEMGKVAAERSLSQAAQMDAPFKGGTIMNSLGPFSMMVSADKDGKPGLSRFGEYTFGEGTAYDHEKDAFVKKDGSVVSNKEARLAAPRVKEWFTMNFSPYIGARTNRDEMLMTLQALGPDHPDAPAVKQKIQEYISLMKNPEWKLQSLEKLKSYVSQIPDDPFGEKANNLARIENEMNIVRGEAVAMTKRAHEVEDIETKHGQAKELKGMEIEAADKRSALERGSRLDVAKLGREARVEAAKIGAGKDDKLTPSEMLSQEKRNIQNFSGKYRITKDPMNGFLTSPEYTEAQVRAIENDAKAMGVGVNFEPVVTKGETRWFSPDEPDTTTYKINSVWGLGQSSPARGGALGGRNAQPGAVAPPQQPAQQPKLATDGEYYLPDPNRPGKYLRVEQDQQPQEDVVAAHTPTMRGTSVYETATPAPTKQAPDEMMSSHYSQAQRSKTSPVSGGLGRGSGKTKTMRFSTGTKTNIDAFKRSSAEAVQIISDLASVVFKTDAPSQEDLIAAAEMAAESTGLSVEQLLSKETPSIVAAAKAVVASQSDARKNIGNVKPYGFR